MSDFEKVSNTPPETSDSSFGETRRCFLGRVALFSGGAAAGCDPFAQGQDVRDKAAPRAKGVDRPYWIQLENRDWDLVPNNIDRLTGQKVDNPSTKKLFKGALVLRRYKPPKKADGSDAWTEPDDRKVNPWDLNETDPSGKGTIPGPVIECNVGDKLIIHFRNMDCRDTDSSAPPRKIPLAHRIHSLHAHGVVFRAEHDGAYPLSPPDKNQKIDAHFPWQKALWEAVGAKEFKMGDRVPPGCSFEYRWETFAWPSTAGVWLYHDHSVQDTDNVKLGAVGILVVHNPDDPDDVFIDFDQDQDEAKKHLPGVDPRGAVTFEDDKKVRRYRKPPKKALYLQLLHQMAELSVRSTFKIQALSVMRLRTDGIDTTNGQAVMNGRMFLGNTPTLVGGTETKMRFGLVAMNEDSFHTFHLHGHRWVIPGPSGGKVGGEVPPLEKDGVQNSPLDRGVSQFEDTKIFGPANSFTFTINQGSFMGPPVGGGAVGEWHMHCHVLLHMDQGMMGSLLIIGANEPQVTEVPIPIGDTQNLLKPVEGERDMCPKK